MAAVGLVLTIAGCGGSPEPKSLDKPSARTSATSDATKDPSPTASASPSGKSGKIITGGAGKVDPATAADVKAFIGDYLAAQNKATGDGDFSAVDAMVESCTVCDASKQYISGAYSSGGKVEGGIFTKPEITVGGQRSDRIVVTVDAVISAYETTSGSGKVVDKGPAETVRYQYSVTNVGESWRIAEGSKVG
ncbi:hypothetical protein [Actinopolymorpha sp. B9G3]|uniref:hypothetical protein n=1 Tax=Actinopolymorpha sp. B9G3 TaxID=3158970 RepID=UPI0032D93038